MSEAERRAKVEAVAKKLRKAVGNLAFRDEQLFAEALDDAFGRRLRVAINYLYEPEDVDEWQERHGCLTGQISTIVTKTIQNPPSRPGEGSVEGANCPLVAQSKEEQFLTGPSH